MFSLFDDSTIGCGAIALSRRDDGREELIRGAMGAEAGIAGEVAGERPIVVRDSGCGSILEAGAVIVLEAALPEIALSMGDCVAPRTAPVVALSASCAALSGRSI
jgi:hypothetical protein